jgi:endonuclease/exonuclease/phosphatase family metal-dependent hydrolase
MVTSTGHAQQGRTATLSGTLKVITYNVAGLPEGISRSRPSVNMPLIGSFLNGYDIAVVQEDFAYARDLRSTLKYPFLSAAFERQNRAHFGDGLSQFAKFPFANFVRRAWSTCHGVLEWGFDCLTPKGFTMARHALADGVFVDVYNLHMDAGSAPGDVSARAAQIEQLLQAIATMSPSQPIIVAGDTNVRRSESEVMDMFRKRAGLEDACLSLRCPEPGRIDKILFRSSDKLKFVARAWRTERRFVDAAGRPLSDHLAVAVDLDFQAFGSPTMTAQR